MSHFTVFLMLFISFFVVSDEYPACDIKVSKEVSFTSTDAKDLLVISVKGNPCYDGELSIKITDNSGKNVYQYKSRYKEHNATHWAERDFDKIVNKHINWMVKDAITDTSSLPEEFPCEIPEPNCEPYEQNTVPKDIYLSYRSQSLPMLNHSTYYEGWASFIYDKEKGKTIKILEGGL